MSSDGTPQSGLDCDKRSMNAVLEHFPDLAATHFICSESPFWRRLTRGFLLLSGGGIACLAWSAQELPWLVTMLLWLASILAIVSAIRMSKELIHYASDAHGVYFPARQKVVAIAAAKPQSWLLVPWPNISRVSVQLVANDSGNTRGVAFCLRASDAEQRVYFSGTAMPDFHEGSGGDRGSVTVMYPVAFRSPHKIVAILLGFQRRQSKKLPGADEAGLLAGH